MQPQGPVLACHAIALPHKYVLPKRPLHILGSVITHKNAVPIFISMVIAFLKFEDI